METRRNPSCSFGLNKINLIYCLCKFKRDKTRAVLNPLPEISDKRRSSWSLPLATGSSLLCNGDEWLFHYLSNDIFGHFLHIRGCLPEGSGTPCARLCRAHPGDGDRTGGDSVSLRGQWNPYVREKRQFLLPLQRCRWLPAKAGKAVGWSVPAPVIPLPRVFCRRLLVGGWHGWGPADLQLLDPRRGSGPPGQSKRRRSRRPIQAPL